MSRIQPIYPNKQVQEILNEQGQQSQIGLNRTSTLTQPVYIKPKGQDDKVMQQAQETVMCRICLQTEHQSTERFIIPCECTGSVKYVHETCFTEWIKTMFTSKNNRELRKIVKEGVNCELCKMKFAVKIMTQKTCITWEKLVEKVQFHRCEFITLLVFLLLALVLLAVTSAMLPSDIFDISFSNQSNTANSKKQTRAGWQKVVLLTSLFALVAMTALVSYLLISEYAFSYRTQFGYKGKEVKTLKGIIVD